jgi:hypothetical protein
MFGLVFATVQLNLPFTFIKSLVVSVTTSTHREGWRYVDELPDDQVCRPDRSAPLPVGLHYCERYVDPTASYHYCQNKGIVTFLSFPVLQSLTTTANCVCLRMGYRYLLGNVSPQNGRLQRCSFSSLVLLCFSVISHIVCAPAYCSPSSPSTA